jgi:hypothetical protein
MNQIISHTESSMIGSSNYNPETKELIVTFKGGTSYSFKDVLTEDYQAFTESESAGKAFNQYIRKYNGLKLEDINETNIEQING